MLRQRTTRYSVGFKKEFKEKTQRKQALLRLLNVCWDFQQRDAELVADLILECLEDKPKSLFDLKEEYCCESIDQLPEHFLLMYDAKMSIFEGSSNKKNKSADLLKSIDEVLHGQDVILKVNV